MFMAEQYVHVSALAGHTRYMMSAVAYARLFGHAKGVCRWVSRPSQTIMIMDIIKLQHMHGSTGLMLIDE